MFHVPGADCLCISSADGRIQAVNRPGNARGNALGSNQAPPPVWPVTLYTWTDDGPLVTVLIPLAQFGLCVNPGEQAGHAAERVLCSFSESSFDLRVVNAGGSKTFRLRVYDLPAGGIQAEVRLRSRCDKLARLTCELPHMHLQACRHTVIDTGQNPRIVVALSKLHPDAMWYTLGTVYQPAKRPLVTVRIRSHAQALHAIAHAVHVSQVKDYTWCDEKMGVRIWIKVPGVHTLGAEAVSVRFRELSFDVTVSDLHGKDFSFAVRAHA